MIIWVLDIDGVLQVPIYPHSMLFAEVAPVVGFDYKVLYDHYTQEFSGNESEENYHLSLCNSGEKRKAVRVLWRKLHDNMLNVKEIPGAKELLTELTERGDPIFAFTKGEKTEGIQRLRLESLGLAQFIPDGQIIASPRKGTKEGLEQDLLPKLPQGRIIIVGDRFYQDIEPVLNREGIICVWVKWPDSDEPLPIIEEADYPNLRIVESTQGLVELVKKGAFDG